MNLFTAAGIAAITGGTLLPGGEPGSAVTGVSIDSRNVQPGDLFFCLPGERHDGHDFISSAVQNGAAGILATRPVDLPAGVFGVQVADATAAMGALAAEHRNRFNIPVVGITGSVGKTTTKELIAAVLQQRWPTLKSEGNFNNELGMPLTLFRMNAAHGAAVLEMGMRGLGQIQALARVARPTAGVVTNVGETHIEILGSIEAIAQAKSELIQAIPPDGLAVLNADDPRVAAMRELTASRTVFYGRRELHHRADIRATDVQNLGLAGVSFKVDGLVTGKLSIPIPGEHNVLNALAAVAIGVGHGLQIEAIARGLLSYTAAPHRLALLNGLSGQRIIDDTYNANPASMRATLRLLGETPCRGKRVAVLGDMLELGSRANEAHREVGHAAKEAGVDLLVAVGSFSGYLAEGARSAGFDPARIFALQDKDIAIGILREQTGAEDIILIKGSRGMRMEDLVGALSATT